MMMMMMMVMMMMMMMIIPNNNYSLLGLVSFSNFCSLYCSQTPSSPLSSSAPSICGVFCLLGVLYSEFSLRTIQDALLTMKRGGSKSGKQHQPPAASAASANGHALSFKLAKLLDPDSSWDKDQLLDVLHWIRQGLGLAFGLLWGSVPLVGGIWILTFLLLSTGIVYGYYTHVLKIDEEDYGGHGTLLQEGLFASFSLFLLSWILIYSLAHF